MWTHIQQLLETFPFGVKANQKQCVLPSICWTGLNKGNTLSEISNLIQKLCYTALLQSNGFFAHQKKIIWLHFSVYLPSSPTIPFILGLLVPGGVVLSPAEVPGCAVCSDLNDPPATVAEDH